MWVGSCCIWGRMCVDEETFMGNYWRFGRKRFRSSMIWEILKKIYRRCLRADSLRESGSRSTGGIHAQLYWRRNPKGNLPDGGTQLLEFERSLAARRIQKEFGYWRSPKKVWLLEEFSCWTELRRLLEGVRHNRMRRSQRLRWFSGAEAFCSSSFGEEIHNALSNPKSVFSTSRII